MNSRPMPLMSARDVCREHVERQYAVPTIRKSVLLYIAVLLSCLFALCVSVWGSGPTETQVAADTEMSKLDAVIAAKAARKEPK